MKTKKIKMSILVQVAFLFLFAGFVAFASIYQYTYHNMLDKAVMQADEVARAVANSALAVFDSREDLDRMYTDEEYRDKMYQAFRFICRKTGIRYLYLYTVDKDNYRHYIVCAANSDEDNDRMQEEYGFGSVRTLPLFHAEANVLSGTADEDYELIDNDYGYVCMHTVPLRDWDGTILALIGADYDMGNIVHNARNNLINSGLMGIMAYAITFGVALFLIWWSVLRPIRKLSERMRIFVVERKETDSTKKRKTLYENEITDIENAFSKMTVDILQYVHDNEILTRKEAYTSAQLDVARNIQKGIVPEKCSISKNHFELHGFAKEAWEVGGDFYDVFSLEDGQECVVIGDISGKGISAAMFMALVKTMIRENLLSGRGLAETLNRVNRELWLSNPEKMFATVFAMALNTESGVLTYANAGHETPLMLGRTPFFPEVRSGMPLGLFENAGITEEKVVLRGGDGILVYTDGVTEAINAKQELYEKDRLRETVLPLYREEIHSYQPQMLVEAVVSSVLAYAGNMEQFDDITCLALVYKDSEAECKVLPPGLESLVTVRDTILQDLGDSDPTRDIILACEEIFTNIVNYSGTDQIIFSGKRSGDVYLVTYIDNGTAFNPVEARPEKKSFEEIAFGGMGIIIARTNSRDMVYSRIDGSNVLLMEFDIVSCIGKEPDPERETEKD